MHTATPHHRYSIRFYIVLTTIIVGGIFLVLFINNDDTLSLTSAAVHDGGGEDADDSLFTITEFETEEESIPTTIKKVIEERSLNIQKEGPTKERSISNEVEFTLSFDQAASISIDEITLEEIELQFTDSTTTIKLNEQDKLELAKLENVPLKLIDFQGKVVIDSGTAILKGKTKILEVNSVALSSKGDIDILIEDLHFQYMGVKGLELKKVELPNGNGKMSAAGKLEYTLNDEEIEIYDYKGSMILDRDSESPLTMEGTVRSVGVSGEQLAFDLR